MSVPTLAPTMATQSFESTYGGKPDVIDSIEEVAKYDHIFFPGYENIFIRYYYYLNNGLSILNQFRNLFLGIFALYFTLHLTDPVLLIGLLVPGVLLLTLIGYYNVHRMNKVQEWLGMRFTTHYGIRSFNYSAGTYELLKEIRDSLQGKNKEDSIYK